jgi:hypothetical protein
MLDAAVAGVHHGASVVPRLRSDIMPTNVVAIDVLSEFVNFPTVSEVSPERFGMDEALPGGDFLARVEYVVGKVCGLKQLQTVHFDGAK